MLTLLILIITGVGVGYLGFRFFKLTIPLWVSITVGVVITLFVAVSQGQALGTLELLVLSTVAILLIVSLLSLFNRTKTTASPAPRTKEPTPPINSRYTINSIQETETSYEPNGHEERTIDNSKNDGYIKRKLTISREWTRTISIEQSATNSYKASAGVHGFFEAGLEQALQDKYHVAINERKTFTEEIELEVLPRSKMVLRIEWKTIWQNGVIEIIDQNQNILFIPYRVSKGLTFDQVQEKVN